MNKGAGKENLDNVLAGRASNGPDMASRLRMAKGKMDAFYFARALARLSRKPMRITKTRKNEITKSIKKKSGGYFNALTIVFGFLFVFS